MSEFREASLAYPLAILFTNSARKITNVNSHFVATFGVAKEEMLGKRLDEFVSARDRRGLVRFQSESIKQTLFQDRLKLSFDGRDFFTEITVSPQTDRTIIYLKHLGEEKTLSDKLVSAETRWKVLSDSIGIGIIIIDRDAKILEVNQTLIKNFPIKNSHGVMFNEEGLIGEELAAILFPKEFTPLLEEIAQFKTDPDAQFTSDISYEKRILDVRAVPIYSSTDGFEGGLIFLRDITDERASEAKLMSSSKLISLGEMAGGIAHEINNPLAIIDGHASRIEEILEDEQLDRSAMSESVEWIHKTVDRVHKIVQGLLLFSRTNDAESMQNIAVKKIIDDMMSFCSMKLTGNGVDVTISVDPTLSLHCRPTQIQQILVNLINNAFDAIQNLSNKWIKIEALKKDQWVEISVTDSGSGIPVDANETIFQPFFTTKAIGKGTGLGLSISTGIAQSHKGEIFVDTSSPNTKFVLRLPQTQEV